MSATHDPSWRPGSLTPGNPLRGADNIIGTPGGDLFVCEDGGNMEIIMISREGAVAPFARITGAGHTSSEVTGVVFNPAGDRMYFSSQRGLAGGITYEVRGPFRGS